MRKEWKSPEIKDLYLQDTKEDLGSITFASDQSGADAQAYAESYADSGIEPSCFIQVWYFYDVCAKRWVSSGKSSLCEAIKYAYQYMRDNYPNGCKVSES